MKPDYITDTDWKILKEMYPNQLDYVKQKLTEHYPVQYLIGYVDFYNTKITVDERVLIPRFETEYLVDKVVKRLKKYPENTLNIVDIGTGSGCIAIALAKELKQHCEGVDISKSALEVASINAFQNNVDIKWTQLDILNNDLPQKYDVIIANPPYLRYDEECAIETTYEPQESLFAANNGLEFYQRIITMLDYQPKLIAFEIGSSQKEAIIKLARETFKEAQITAEKDLTGRDRYIFIEN